MAKVDAEKAVDLMKRMKLDVRNILTKYSVEAAELAVNSADPHSPVIGCAQMALANASSDYMVFCGANPLESFNITVNITGQAMQQWVDAVMKMQNIKVDPVGAPTLEKQ